MLLTGRCNSQPLFESYDRNEISFDRLSENLDTLNSKSSWETVNSNDLKKIVKGNLEVISLSQNNAHLRDSFAKLVDRITKEPRFNADEANELVLMIDQAIPYNETYDENQASINHLPKDILEYLISLEPYNEIGWVEFGSLALTDKKMFDVYKDGIVSTEKTLKDLFVALLSLPFKERYIERALEKFNNVNICQGDQKAKNELYRKAILSFCTKLPICNSGEGDNLMNVLNSNSSVYLDQTLVRELLKRAAKNSTSFPGLCYDSELKNNFVFAYLKALKLGGIKPSPEILFLDIYGKVDKRLALAFSDAVCNSSSIRGLVFKLSSLTGLEHFKTMLEFIKEGKKIYKIKFEVEKSSLDDVEKLIGETFENIEKIEKTYNAKKDREIILCILKKNSSSPQASDSLPKTKIKPKRSKQRCI